VRRSMKSLSLGFLGQGQQGYREACTLSLSFLKGGSTHGHRPWERTTSLPKHYVPSEGSVSGLTKHSNEMVANMDSLQH